MGWFGRAKPDVPDEFYRGDAPVMMPGADGGAPTAYPQRDQPQIEQSPFNPSQFGRPSNEPSQFDRPSYDPTARPEQQFRQFGPAAPRSGPPVDLTKLPAPTGQAGRLRITGFSCLAVVLLFVVGGGLLVYFAISSSVQSAFPGFGDDSPATVNGSIDVPVTVAFHNTDLEITVSGTQSQPGSGFSSSYSAERPDLVVAVSLLQLDTAATPLTIPFTYWSFTPAGSATAENLNIVSGYDSSIETADLTPGQTENGYLVFETAAISGTLSLQSYDFGAPDLVSWTLTATPAAVVEGAVDVPVQGQIGRPPFTVTLLGSSPADAGSEQVWKPPASGSYLIADFVVASTGAGSSGVIDSALFVFLPAGAFDDVPAAGPGNVKDTTSIASVSDGSSTPIRVAFDVPAGPGTIEMRDAAGRAMIAWPVA